MISDDKQSDANMKAELVARCIADLLTTLHKDAEIPLPLMIAAAHAQVVTMMARIVGGQIAAERCVSAAEHVRGIPSISDAALAAAEPQGHA